jgi:N-methylhydantoinase A
VRIGVDIGGTFTDIVSAGAAGELRVDKVLTTPDDPAEGFLEGLAAVAPPAGERLDVVHGTTVGTNAILERKGAATGFVTTAGFRDLLELQNQERSDIWDLAYEKTPPLVARSRCFEVRERLDAEGRPLVTPSREDLEVLRAEVDGAGVESVAVCLLHSYRNRAHEDLVADVLGVRGRYLVSSSALAPQFREYDRASTTVMSAYIGPVLEGYLGTLGSELGRRAADAELLVMQSNGGVLAADEAAAHAVGSVLSGPAGGVIAATVAGRLARVANLISFDMGGTSTDVCLVPDGNPQIAQRSLVAGLPVITPMFQIDTVGAGGGSIAWVDDGGLLRVGPQSAGGRPGPAAYGRGGTEATVTDALVVLGLLRGAREFGGAVHLDRAAAETAVAQVAHRLGTTTADAAESIVRLANHRMGEAVRRVSLNQGYDPRDFVLVAFGGAGPAHAAWVAEEIGIPLVVVPLHAGVFSAVGLLYTDFRFDRVYSTLSRLDDGLPLAELLRAFEERAREEAGSLGADSAAMTEADLRYRGQAHSLTVPVSANEPADAVVARFHAAHERRYGFRQPGTPVELVNVRVALVRAREKPELVPEQREVEEPEAAEVTLGGVTQTCTFVERRSLVDAVEGPAVIEEPTATTIVPRGWTAASDERGLLHLRRGREV